MIDIPGKIAFIGSGNMAAAIIGGIGHRLSPGADMRRQSGNPVSTGEVQKQFGAVPAEPEALRTADVIVIAVKPQTFPKAAEAYKNLVNPGALFISIMAGLPTAAVEDAFGGVRTVRVMPNIAMAVGCGASGYAPGKFATETDLAITGGIFSASGLAVLITEDEINDIGALSGSGAAYVYYLIEALRDAAVADGMEPPPPPPWPARPFWARRSSWSWKTSRPRRFENGSPRKTAPPRRRLKKWPSWASRSRGRSFPRQQSPLRGTVRRTLQSLKGDKIMSEKLFNKVMVANRGEIAIRIFRACYDLDIRAVAIYSKEDTMNLFRTKADEAYLIGEKKSPLGAYLAIDEIIPLAKKRGVEAIHPGYGFLSENAAFAKACEDAGIKFIGPPSSVLAKMGDKLEAKKIARACGVPSVPGATEPRADAEEALRKAEEFGFPVILKAAAGGGGRGMRLCESPGEIAPAFDLVKSEAKKAFGDDSIFIEKYLVDPSISRSRSWRTNTAASGTWVSATAPSSAAIRRSSNLPPPGA
jgi:pyrroline-5-carboxylate reductase